MARRALRTGPLETIIVLLIALILVFAIGAIGAAVTQTGPGSWYETLAKPSFTPPDSVFGPVWTVLYLLMALAACLAWRTARPSRRLGAAALFLLQLGLNGLWPPLFFGIHRIGLALADQAALLVAASAMAIAFWRIRALAGLLVVPYLAWLLFAAALNAAIWRLNAA